MSKTIVRLSGYDADDSAFYVDWDQIDDRARFTVPIDHPLSIELRDKGCRDTRFTVDATEQFEWHVDNVSWTKHECQCTLIGHVAHARRCTASSDYLVELGMVV